MSIDVIKAELRRGNGCTSGVALGGGCERKSQGNQQFHHRVMESSFSYHVQNHFNLPHSDAQLALSDASDSLLNAISVESKPASQLTRRKLLFAKRKRAFH